MTIIPIQILRGMWYDGDSDDDNDGTLTDNQVRGLPEYSAYVRDDSTRGSLQLGNPLGLRPDNSLVQWMQMLRLYDFAPIKFSNEPPRVQKWVGRWGRPGWGGRTNASTRLSATIPRPMSVQGMFQSRWAKLKNDILKAPGKRAPDPYPNRTVFLQRNPQSFYNTRHNERLWMKLRLWLRRARNRIFNMRAAALLQSTRGNGSMSSMYNRTLRSFNIANTKPPRLPSSNTRLPSHIADNTRFGSYVLSVRH